MKITKLESIRKLFNNWTWHNLTIFGKITIIKSLAIPMLVHLLRSLPSPDENFFKEFDNIIFKFIWNGKPDKIKRTVLINDIQYGGAKLTHLRSFSKSLKIFWIKKMLDDNYAADWKNLFSDKLSKVGGNCVWQYHPKSFKDISVDFNPFWRNIFEIWQELNTEIIYNESDFRSRPLWFNPDIKIGKSTIFLNNLSINGINFVNDLISHDGNFLKHEDFNRLYILNLNHLTYNGIIGAIPRTWKTQINTNGSKLDTLSHFWIDKIKRYDKHNKVIYIHFLEKIAEKPSKADDKWKEKLNEDIKFEEYYLAQYNSLKFDSTLRAFQYKINNRILATNSLLYKMSISPYDLCDFCFTSSETIEHFFWECMDIRNILFQIFADLDLENKIPGLLLNSKLILFGYIEENCHQKSFNLFLTSIKYFIYKCKLDSKKPTFEGIRLFVTQRCKTHTNVYFNLDFGFMRGWLDR